MRTLCSQWIFHTGIFNDALLTINVLRPIKLQTIVITSALQSIPVKVRQRVALEHEADVLTARLPRSVSGRVVMMPSPVV